MNERNLKEYESVCQSLGINYFIVLSYHRSKSVKTNVCQFVSVIVVLSTMDLHMFLLKNIFH